MRQRLEIARAAQSVRAHCSLELLPNLRFTVLGLQCDGRINRLYGFCISTFQQQQNCLLGERLCLGRVPFDLF